MGKIIKNGIIYSGNNTMAVTQEEYDTLTQAQKENGTIYFITNGVPTTTAASYVIEQGTSDIWTYRKWSDGTAECWTKGNYTGTIAANSHVAVGSIFGNFPDIFIAQPVATVSGGGTSNPNVFVAYTSVYLNGSRYRIDVYLRNNSGTACTNGWVYCQVIGRWK